MRRNTTTDSFVELILNLHGMDHSILEIPDVFIRLIDPSRLDFDPDSDDTGCGITQSVSWYR